MKRFSAICAKWGQRVDMVVQYPSIDIAREELHKQGYSIMELKEADDSIASVGGVFLFEVSVNGQKKSGQIRSSDIFKAYIKLVEDLRYEVVSIYSEGDISDEDKAITTQKVRESYLIYKNIRNTPEKKEEVKAEKKEIAQNTNFFQKDLLKYTALIEGIINKIETILVKYHSHIEAEREIRLKNLITSLKQLKNITNIDKLRVVGESALLKIGELELELAQKQTDIKKEEFFKETNQLLKQLGSSKRIASEKEQILKKIKLIVDGFIKNFTTAEEKKQEKKEDTNNFLFYKNLRELDIYKVKLQEVRKEIFSLALHFDFKSEKRNRLLLKKKLIEQNINLLKNRISKKNLPYLRIIKGLSYYSDVFFYGIRSFGDLLLYSLFIYSFGFFLVSTFEKFLNISLYHQNIFSLTLIALIGFFLRQSKTTLSFCISSACVVLGFIFLFINF